MNGGYRKHRRRTAVLHGVILALMLKSPSARTLGLVADNATASVTVFDADSETVLGAVTIPPGVGGVIGDVLISPDQTRGFVTNANYEVFAIDLTTLPAKPKSTRYRWVRAPRQSMSAATVRCWPRRPEIERYAGSRSTVQAP